MTKEPLKSKLGSPGKQVEVDETYIGGKAGNSKHKNHVPKKKMAVLTLYRPSG